MGGIPALDLLDLVVEVFHSHPNQSSNTKDQVRGNSSRNTTSNKHTQKQTKVPTQHDNVELRNVDYVSSNAKSSQFGAMLDIFLGQRSSDSNDHERKKSNNETRIQNPQSCSYWSFDRINLDPKIQIKYVDTKHQLADILT